MKRSDFAYHVGIDEVGRGPIAGPVAVGAFIFLNKKASRLFRGVKESKQLTEAQREEWFEKIQESKKHGHIDFSVTFQSESIIDTKGLSCAIKTALKKSLTKVSLGFNPKNLLVLLDGGLRAPAEFVHQKTIIKGDEKEMVIALASICAKVLRDRRMKKAGQKFPQYGFEIHKGYGTARHYQAIQSFGQLSIHRKSFLTKLYSSSK